MHTLIQWKMIMLKSPLFFHRLCVTSTSRWAVWWLISQSSARNYLGKSKFFQKPAAGSKWRLSWSKRLLHLGDILPSRNRWRSEDQQASPGPWNSFVAIFSCFPHVGNKRVKTFCSDSLQLWGSSVMWCSAENHSLTSRSWAILSTSSTFAWWTRRMWLSTR